jgi:hypothetical protein
MFENDTSPLYRSNDGRLQVDTYTGVEGRSHVLVDTKLDRYAETRDLRDISTNLHTQQQIVVDAFIAGYDYCQRLVGEQPDDEHCDECGSLIPDEPGGSLVNSFHLESCSLYDTQS